MILALGRGGKSLSETDQKVATGFITIGYTERDHVEIRDHKIGGRR